jgi:hypothetical protein
MSITHYRSWMYLFQYQSRRWTDHEDLYRRRRLVTWPQAPAPKWSGLVTNNHQSRLKDESSVLRDG